MDKSMRRFVIRNPFFCVALLAGIAFGLMIVLGRIEGLGDWSYLMFRIWFTIGWPFARAGSLMHEIAPNLAQWLDVAAVIVLGLMPYLIADWIWGLVRRRFLEDRGVERAQ